jgi:hypothetical protein
MPRTRFGGFRHYRKGRFLPTVIAGNRASDIPVALSILADRRSVNFVVIVKSRSPRPLSRLLREKQPFLQPEIPSTVKRSLASTPVLVAKPDIADCSFLNASTLPLITASKRSFALQPSLRKKLAPLTYPRFSDYPTATIARGDPQANRFFRNNAL